MEIGRTSQVPGEPHGAYALFFDPGGTGRTRPIRCADLAPVLTTTKATRDKKDFGAPSHGLDTRCLRFAERVARTGRKTRFSLLAKLSDTGLGTRRVPTKGFRPLSSSSPKLSWRNVSSFFGLPLATTGA
jgi:hypothetical protein